MDTETAANPAGGEDTRVVDAASEAATQGATAPAGGEVSEETTGEELEGLDDLLNEAPAEPELVEVEVDGKKIKVSPEGRDYLLRQADYTRKTMEAAEIRKRAEEVATWTTAELRAQAQLEDVRATVAQYSQWTQADWANLKVNDPEAFDAHYERFNEARATAPQIEARLAEHFRLKAEREQQDTAKFRDEVEKAMSKEFADWPTRKPELQKFAAEHGIDEETFAAASPNELKLVNLARIGAQFIQRQRDAARQKAAQAVQPAPEVKGKTVTVNPLDDKASTKAWIEARNAQLKRG